MIYGSVCSGIEAASVAWEPLGWSAAWLSEIEKFPSAVLSHRYPEISNLGDMTKLYANQTFQKTPIDLLVGGTPCQSFSVAGLRQGLSDPRGNLCLEFLRLVDIKRPRWFVWENVPGVLSSGKGRDFGSFLGAIQQLGYGWAYRILDAQYFGVPQRRRRVFVVGYLGDWRPAASVLFEPQSLCGHIKKGREARKAVAALTSTGVGTCGADDNQAGHLIQTFDRQSTGEYGTDTVASTVSARDYKSASDLICFSAKDYGADASDKAPTLRSGGHTKSHANAGVMPAICITGTKTHALKADGFDGSEDGTGRGQPIIAFQTKGSNLDIGEISGTFGSNADRASGSAPMVCQPTKQHAVGVSLRGRKGGATAELTKGASPALRASQGGGDKPHVLVKSCVRRLTPRECERLQGFPDDCTLLPTNGKKAADGPRYKALGNSMAVPVMRWIGKRIQKVDNIIRGIKE